MPAAKKSLDDLYKEIESLSNADALAYAKKMCEEEGGEWCVVVDDLGGGDRSIFGVNMLGAVVIRPKQKAKITGYVIAAVLLVAILVWYFKFYKK